MLHQKNWLILCLVISSLFCLVGCQSKDTHPTAHHMPKTIHNVNISTIADDLARAYPIAFEKNGNTIEGRSIAHENLADYKVLIQSPNGEYASSIQYTITPTKNYTQEEKERFLLQIEDFFTYAATSPFKGNDPDKAQHWVKTHYNNALKTQEKTTIGHLSYSIETSKDGSVSLIIQPL